MTLPHSTEYRDKVFGKSLKLSRHGDKAAQYSLQRISRREPDSPQGQLILNVLIESSAAQ